MTEFRTKPSRPLRLMTWSFVAIAVAMAVTGVTQAASGTADTFRALSAKTRITRDVSLRDLGFTAPIVMGVGDNSREIYLPVPAGVPLNDAAIQFDADYLRGDAGRSNFVLSLDGYPVASRLVTQETGSASMPIGVDGNPRATGFVRFGISWNSVLPADVFCIDGRSKGNFLRIQPSSRFRYSYDAAAVRDLATAWSALPKAPVILVAHTLSANSYDTAWRAGLALERMGKHPVVVALPVSGEEVDLTGVSVPDALKVIPAFAALAEGGKRKLGNAAEVGALFALGYSGPGQPDLMVADTALQAGINAAMDALRDQITSAAPDALPAFADWRARDIDLAFKPGVSNEVRLSNAVGRPVIVMAADAGAHASGLMNETWRRALLSTAIVAQASDVPQAENAKVSLKFLGAVPGSFDVLAHGEWSSSFDLSAVAGAGNLPVEVVVDVSAAPSAGKTHAVASLFLNNILLGARYLDANGQSERINARIPRSVLAQHNVLRVSFVRQMASNLCLETPEPFPVAVLPSSHIILNKVEPGEDFTGMAARFAANTQVMVSDTYLSDAEHTLPRVIRLTAASGVVPQRATFVVVPATAPQVPTGAFLALDLAFPGAKTKTKVEGGRLVINGNSDHVLVDVNGLNHAGIVEIDRISGQPGIVYRTLGAEAPNLDTPFILGNGDLAVVGSNGVLVEVDTHDASGYRIISETEDDKWQRNLWWLLPVAGITLFLLLVVIASRLRRHKKAI